MGHNNLYYEHKRAQDEKDLKYEWEKYGKELSYEQRKFLVCVIMKDVDKWKTFVSLIKSLKK